MPQYSNEQTSSGACTRIVWMFAASILLTSSGLASESLECLIEPHQLVDVSSSEIGLLELVKVKKADVVKKGDVLAKLRDEVELIDFQVSRSRADATADLKLLSHDLEYNTRKLDRANQLDKSRVLSAQEIDEIFMQKNAARLRVLAATERQKIAQLEAVRDEIVLTRRMVRSPIDGVVVHRHKNPGEYVDADTIVQLAQLDPLRIEVVLPMLKYGDVHKGMTATVVPELPIDGPFIATVVSVDPMMDAATATFGVTLTLPNPDLRLPAGLKCTLTLQLQHANNTDEGSLTEAYETPTRMTVRTVDSSLEEPELGASSKSESDINPQSAGVSAALLSPSDAETGCKQNDNNTQKISAEHNVGDASAMDNTDKWLVLSPSGTPDISERFQKAQKAGVKNLVIFDSGLWKGQLSYGHYSNRVAAEDRLNEMQSLGFDAVIVSSTNRETSSTTNSSSDSQTATRIESNCTQPPSE